MRALTRRATRCYAALSSFNPRTLPGIALWLDAADTSSLVIDTGVSAWRNKAGTGVLAFTQSTGNLQPLSGTARVNGRNALVFDGVDDQMTATDPFMTGTTYGTLPFSLWIVQQVVSLTNFGMTYATGGLLEVRQNGNSGISQVSTNSGTIHTFSVGGAGVTEMLSLVFTPGSVDNLFWRNGVSQTLNGIANLKPPTATTTHTIGRRTGAAFPANVRICEIIACQSQANDAARSAVDRYLGNKWGVPIA